MKLPTKEGGYTRTGSRTPMQWDNTQNLGFSGGDADSLYLPVDPAADAPTVAAQQDDPDSLLNTVRALLALRHAEGDLQADAPFEALCTEKGKPFVYRRSGLTLAVNPSGEALTWKHSLGALTPVYRLGEAIADGDSLTMGPQSFAVFRRG